MLKNKVVIWGADDFNTLGLLRQLSKPEIDLFFLIKGPLSYASKSRYCVNYRQTPTIKDGCDFLLQEFSKEENKPIIITSGDGIITFIDKHRDILAPYFILPGTIQQGLISRYIDKNNMTNLATKHNFLCPKSRFVRWDSDISNVEYPCIIKPSHETPGHYNEFKTKICNNAKELCRTLKYVRRDSEFILQQYIPKELDLLVYGARMADGKVVIAGSMVRDRFADSGSSSHGYMTSDICRGANIEGIVSFLSEIDYYGPFSFEYGLVGEQTYFFEVNLRNDGTSHYFYQAGANIPLAYVYSCLGLKYDQIPTRISCVSNFVDEVFDIENVLHGRLSYKQWKQDKSEATIYKYYDKDDEEPWRYVYKRRFKQILQDLILKKYRLYIVRILEKFGLRK